MGILLTVGCYNRRQFSYALTVMFKSNDSLQLAETCVGLLAGLHEMPTASIPINFKLI